MGLWRWILHTYDVLIIGDEYERALTQVNQLVDDWNTTWKNACEVKELDRTTYETNSNVDKHLAGVGTFGAGSDWLFYQQCVGLCQPCFGSATCSRWGNIGKGIIYKHIYTHTLNLVFIIIVVWKYSQAVGSMQSARWPYFLCGAAWHRDQSTM